MSSIVEEKPEPVVLVIADISGYTQYMTANAKTLAHSQTLITELVKSILEEIDLPLEIAKLEGDAVFLFARKNREQNWAQSRQWISQKLFRIFESFNSKTAELSAATTCTCAACAHVQKLKLKLIVHSGEALFHQVLQFQELAGVDVIIIHRLLKNSIEAAQYLLLTEAAQKEIDLPPQVKLIKRREHYEGLGEISVGVCYPAETSSQAPMHGNFSFRDRFRTEWKLFIKLWFKPFSPRELNVHFTHLADKTGQVERIGFAFLTAILTPIFLPVKAVFIFLRAFQPWKTLDPNEAMAHPDPAHRHKPDGSCCETHSRR